MAMCVLALSDPFNAVCSERINTLFSATLMIWPKS
jgi:hypothetical protein